jgi:hypothetical protein
VRSGKSLNISAVNFKPSTTGQKNKIAVGTNAVNLFWYESCVGVDKKCTPAGWKRSAENYFAIAQHMLLFVWFAVLDVGHETISLSPRELVAKSETGRACIGNEDEEEIQDSAGNSRRKETKPSLYLLSWNMETSRVRGQLSSENCSLSNNKQQNKFRGFSPRAHYTNRATSACWRSPTFADRRCHVVSVTDFYGRIIGFLDRAVWVRQLKN